MKGFDAADAVLRKAIRDQVIGLLRSFRGRSLWLRRHVRA
jgi:hypothetical protein